MPQALSLKPAAAVVPLAAMRTSDVGCPRLSVVGLAEDVADAAEVQRDEVIDDEVAVPNGGPGVPVEAAATEQRSSHWGEQILHRANESVG
jgi:hypothetical protein